MKRLFRLPASKSGVRRDVEAELTFHLEGRIEELVARGLSREDAEREARRRFGDEQRVRDELEQLDETARERRAVSEWAGDLARDARVAVRSLARRPAFTLAVTATLALGIGANTAIFSVADALLFRPPPYPHPEQLVSVWSAQTHPAGEYVAVMSHTKLYSAVSAYAEWQMTVGNDAGSFRADGSDASDNLFTMLGAKPAIGHTFTSGASKPGMPREAVLSDELWRSRFSGDSAVVGRSILVEGVARTVVGVMPRDFHFPALGTQLWIPSTFDAANVGNYWGWWKYRLAGRLEQGATVSAATAELRASALDFRRANALWDPGPDYGRNASVTPLQAQLSGPGRTTMLVLLGVVFALLLIACANVANLVLVNAIARERELAVRRALGCSRARLVAQLLGENFLLAASGGAVAVAIAWGGVALLSSALPPQIPRTAAIGVDLRVLGFTLALVLVAWLAFGLAPALRAAAAAPGRALPGARGASHGVEHRRIAGALTMVQLALAVVLVTGSGLLLRSLGALQRADPGFTPGHVVAARVTLPTATYRDTTRRAAFFDALFEKVSAVPGLASAAMINRPPLRGPVYGLGARIEGQAEDLTRTLPTIDHEQVVSAGYFETMGIRIVQGRSFNADDRAGAPVTVVVSESMAKRFWPRGDAVGKHVGFPFASPWLTIVGVVADVKQDSLNADRNQTLYRSMAQAPQTDVTIVARTAGGAAAFGEMVREAVATLDRTVPVSDVRTMTDIVSTSLARARFTALLITGFAFLALALGAVGIYGVVSFSVAQRSREMGVRMALGATPGNVLGLVLGRGAWLAGAGTALGIGASLLTTRALSGLLYGVSAWDGLTFVVAPALLFGVAVLATLVPARRAVKADPLTALRAD